MKKNLKMVIGILLSLTIALTLPASAFAAEPADNPNESSEDSQVVKLAFTDAPTLTIGGTTINHPSYAAMLAFKGALETSTNGAFTVELYTSGILGDANENLQNLMSGTLTGCTPADGTLSGFANDVSVFSIPYLFDTPLTAYDILDSDFGTDLWDAIAEETGLRIIGAWDNGGYRNFSNSKRPITCADDMAGLKIRVQESEVYMTLVEGLGATVTPMAFLELYSGLQTGVVDGEENSAITILGASLEEVQPYYTLDNHLLGLAFLVIDNNWYNSLDAETQEYVLQAGRTSAIAARGVSRQAEKLAIEEMAASGVEIYYPTEAEKQTFKDATQEQVAEFLRGSLSDPALVDELIGRANSGNYGRGVQNVAVAGAEDSTALADSTAVEPAETANTNKSAGNNTLVIILALISVVSVLTAVFALTRKPKNSSK